MTFGMKFSGVKDNFETGATRDQAAGKGRYDLISTHMLRRLAGVYERGAKNHGDRNWERGIPLSRLYSSAMRHTMQALAGMTDEDHLGQAIWNLAAIIHFEEAGRTELDDRKVEAVPFAEPAAKDPRYAAALADAQARASGENLDGTQRREARMVPRGA